MSGHNPGSPLAATTLQIVPRREIGPTGLVIWHLPGNLQIMWSGPGARLRIGWLTQPSGASTFIDHPTARYVYATLSEAQAAVEAFLSA